MTPTSKMKTYLCTTHSGEQLFSDALMGEVVWVGENNSKFPVIAKWLACKKIAIPTFSILGGEGWDIKECWIAIESAEEVLDD